jgi:hypothetical protein
MKKNLKVEYKAEKSKGSDDELRVLYYRVDPSELSPIERILRKNDWKEVVQAYVVFDGVTNLFNYDEACYIRDTYKTLGDIENYIERERKLSKKHKQETEDKWANF